MSKRTNLSFFFLIFFIFLALNPFGKIATCSLDPFTNVRPGWDVITIYEIPHPPGASCVGQDGDLFYADNLNHVIMRMDEFGTHTEYISTGSLNFNDIEYQPNSNRIIGVTDYGFYTITSIEIQLLNNYSYASTLSALSVDPTDDSFYCGSLFDGTAIFHYDANGNNLTTVLSDVQGCSQLILNNNQSILYYSESYLGYVSSLNLSSLETTLLRTDVGLPGTQEVIGIGVDDNDILYCMTADGNNRGFYQYDSGTFDLLMASKAGMSRLTWFSKLHMFIAGASAGACLVGYDPDENQAQLLTAMVNTYSIAEAHDGKILYAYEDEIFQINESGPSQFADTTTNLTVSGLVIDKNDDIYGLLSNDSACIYKINHDGSTNEWFTNIIFEYGKSLQYDVKNDQLILLADDLIQNQTNIYQIPIENPTTFTKLTTFENSTKTGCVVDNSGNIYLYEASNNSLYKIPDGSIDREIITTNFVNFTGIYTEDYEIVPPMGYSTIENGILIGRNDDLQIWLLDDAVRVPFAINVRGIDNSAIFQNTNNDLIITQSTAVLKCIYQEPPQHPPIGKIILFTAIPLGILGIAIVVVILRRKNKLN
ncbi:MAG: hypothetical protein EU530_04670 [Promethearchaeota archaeon]|nr:MAG: hypothetical protein EU530_04670 [Candidatus Lokiarchaeota archaeon]